MKQKMLAYLRGNLSLAEFRDAQVDIFLRRDELSNIERSLVVKFAVRYAEMVDLGGGEELFARHLASDFIEAMELREPLAIASIMPIGASTTSNVVHVDAIIA
jgi:hypothetical protein